MGPLFTLAVLACVGVVLLGIAYVGLRAFGRRPRKAALGAAVFTLGLLVGAAVAGALFSSLFARNDTIPDGLVRWLFASVALGGCAGGLIATRAARGVLTERWSGP